jgi:HlyD family secretion protein
MTSKALRVICLVPLALAAGSCSKGRSPEGIPASGTIETREVDVAPKVGGQLAELRVEEGDKVAPGDELAVVDHSGLDIQLKQAEAGVALAEAQLALLRKGARSEDIQQAEDRLKQAEASQAVAAQDAERMRALASTGSATVKQKEDAEARLIVADAERSAAREALNKVRQLSRPEEIRAAEARLAQARAGADLLRHTVSDCTILAPVGGFVSHKAVEAGEVVAQGATLLTISRLESVYVMLYVTEIELGRIRLRDPVDVRIDAFPERVFSGRVTYISEEAEFTPKNIQTKDERVKLVFGVKVEIANEEGLLKPGLPADAVIRVARDAA